VAGIVGLAAPLLIGFMGLAIDIAMWEGTKVGAQAAADQAALAAGLAIGTGGSAQSEARAVAASFGYVHGTGGVAVTVNRPPSQGPYASNPNAVEVVVSKPEGPYFSQAFRPTAPTVNARSVSAPIGTSAGGGMCVLALAPSGTGITINGTPLLDARTCNVYVNSSSRTSVNLVGQAVLRGYDIFLVGGFRTTGQAALLPTDELQTYFASPTADPYAARTIPAFSGCNHTGHSVTGAATFTAGATPYVFCDGLSISGSGTVTFNPGVYVIDKGDLNISGSGTINATGGVTFIVTRRSGQSAGDIGGVSASGTGPINIRAPATGPSAGIAVWVDKRATSRSFGASGGRVWNITGAIYAPSTSMTWSGGGASTCTQLVANTLTVSGNVELKHECDGVGVSDPPGSTGSTISRLVE
jgi:hypothetical protein